MDPQDILKRNMAYAVARKSYLTQLDPQTENAFNAWVKENNIPFDPSATADYDMRGFFLGKMNGLPQATTGMNPNDGQLHFGDYYKTPYHKSFSVESQYATHKAPRWINDSQLALPSGDIVYDERAQ